MNHRKRNTLENIDNIQLNLKTIPWVAVTIVVFSLLIHMFTSGKVESKTNEFYNKLQEAEQYYYANPDLQLDEESKKILFQDKIEQLKAFSEHFMDRARMTEEDKKKLEDTFERMGEIQQELYDRLREQYGGEEREEKPPIEERQANFDRLIHEVKLAGRAIPTRKFGYIPASPSLLSLFTYPFFNTGTRSLLFGVLFLLAAGFVMELLLGRILFGAIFVFFGIISAVIFGMMVPAMNSPFIGTSALTAGILGIVTFFYFSKFKVFIFVWILLELFSAQLFDSVNPFMSVLSFEESEYFVWTKLLVFALGILAAFGIKHLRWHEKFGTIYEHAHIPVNDTIDADGDELFTQIKDMVDTDRFAEAYEFLLKASSQDLLLKHPVMIDMYWNVSIRLNKTDETLRAVTGLMDKKIRTQQIEDAVQYFKLLANLPEEAPFNLSTGTVMIEALTERGHSDAALDLAAQLMEQVKPETPASLLIRYCEAAIKLQPGTERQVAKAVLNVCTASTQLLPEQKETLKNKIISYIPAADSNQKGNHSQGSPSSSPDNSPGNSPGISPGISPANPRITSAVPTGSPAPNPAGNPTGNSTENHSGNTPGFGEFISIDKKEEIAPKKVTAYLSVPLEVRKDKLKINIQPQGIKELPINLIKVISVAKISSDTAKPVLLIDLCLTDPNGPEQEIRTVRILSSSFNPMTFVPKAKNGLEAIQTLLLFLLRTSGARPYPGLEYIQLQKYNSFSSVTEYENSIAR